MKAKILATGDIIDVVKDWDNIGGVVYVGYADKDGNFYQENELELNPDTSEKVIEGWVAKDHAYADVDFYTQEPYWNDESEMWGADGRKCTFSPDLFPDLAVEKPKKVKITITPME